MTDGGSGVQVERDGAVLTVTLDRPDANQALDWRAREAMVEAIEQAAADLSVRAVLLTASGTRADLRVPLPEPAKPDGAPKRAQGDVARGIATGWQRAVTTVLDCEKPVVAAVNGTAAGAGMHLALACDVVVMADSAKLVPVFVRRGIAPDAAGAYLLTRLVGPAVAKRMYLFGDDIPAADALAMGLVSEVVPAAEVVSRGRALAQRLAAGPTRTLAVTKRLINRALDGDRDTALAEEAWGQELVMTTEDANEAIKAFIEKRDPSFKGW
jgi:2-(1,2-epoxy-1,2-dihydrophenyl)acetyl-CoA isomerase